MIYDTFAEVYNQFLDTELLDRYVTLVKKHRTDGIILDLGTGTGHLAIRLKEEGYTVHGADTSESMLELATNNAVEQGVHIPFFIHNILSPIHQLYDGITMSSDVINYLHTIDDVKTALFHIQQAMHQDSIFIFDALRVSYINQMDQFSKTITLEDDSIQWTVVKTNQDHQLKHTLVLGNSIETHIQTTYPQKMYKMLLKEANLEIIEKQKTKERIIFVCKIHP